MKKITLTLIILVLTFQYAYADEMNNDLVHRFDLNSKTLCVDGVWSEEGNQTVSLSVKRHDGKELSEVNTPITFNVFFTDETGGIHISEKLPETLQGGRYDIILASKGKKVDDLYFIYVNESEEETIDVMNAVNNESDSAKLKELLILSDAAGNNAAKIGVDLEDKYIKQYFESFIEEINDIRKSLENNEFSSVSHFHEVMNSFIAVSLMNSGNTDEAMKNYSSYFSTTYEEYSKLDSDVKEYLDEYLKNSEFDILSLSATYRDCLILSELKACLTWSHFEDKIKENAGIIKIDIDDEKEVSKSLRYKIYMNMFDMRDDFESLDDVADAFEDTVSDVASSENKKSAGSSGGGGGSKKNTAVVSPEFMTPVINEEPAPGVSTPVFYDIESHFSRESVEKLCEMGIVNGYSDKTFKPDNSVTRAEFAKMASELFNIRKTGDCSFDDVNKSDWYYESVCSLALTGIVKGYGNLFGSGDLITREDAAVILERCAKYCNFELTGTFEFTDSNEISDYASGAVGKLASNGIIKGDGTGFNPKNNITRGEVAVMLLRLYEKMQ